MDPTRDHKDLSIDGTFDSLLAKREIREEVASRIFVLHSKKNTEYNKQNPAAVPLSINHADIKLALQGLEREQFVAFRDCKMTIQQIKMWIIYRETGKFYTAFDDLRENIDVEFLVKP